MARAKGMATEAQLAALATGRPIGAPKGGQAVKRLRAPQECPRCRRGMVGVSWHQWLGHLGLHGLADAHFGGDIYRAQTHLRMNGMARTDPYPENGAWPRYVPVAEGRE